MQFHLCKSFDWFNKLQIERLIFEFLNLLFVLVCRNATRWFYFNFFKLINCINCDLNTVNIFEYYLKYNVIIWMLILHFDKLETDHIYTNRFSLNTTFSSAHFPSQLSKSLTCLFDKNCFCCDERKQIDGINIITVCVISFYAFVIWIRLFSLSLN